MPATVERSERWRVPTHLDTSDGIGPLNARQLIYLAGAGLYAGPALAALLGPLGPALGWGVPFVSDDLTVGQLGMWAATVAAAVPFALSGEPPLEHGAGAWMRYQTNPKLLGPADGAVIAGVQSVDGAIVHAASGKPLRAVWELPSVNTRLADADLLASLRERYAGFLNAITFPFQIVLRSTPVDTDALLATLDDWADARTMHLAEWLRALLAGRGLVERRRFLAVGAEDDGQLADRVEAIEQGLHGLELTGRRVGVGEHAQPTPELCELLHSGWSKRALKPSKRLGPSVVHIGSHALSSDGMWQSAIAVSRWPHAVDDDWLRRLIAGPLPLDVVWHIRPVDSGDAQRTLGDRLKKWETSSRSVARTIAIEDAHHLQEALERGTEGVWDVDVLILGRGRSEHEARALMRKAQRILAEQGARAQGLRWEQAAGVVSCQPLADNRLMRRSRRVDTSSLARTYPFGGAELVLEGGVPIGETKEGARPVVWTPHRRPLLPNAHLLALGPSGCGKGVLVKVSYSRLYFARILQQIDVIDQDGEHTTGEYGRFAEYCGGIVHYLHSPEDVDRYARGKRPDVVVWNLADVPLADRPETFVKIKRQRWQQSAGGRIRSALVVDELWSFLRDPTAAIEVEDVIRKGRHVKVGGVFMTQRASDCLQSDNGAVLLSQASSQWFGMMAPSELTAVAGPLELSAAAQATIRHFRQGDGLMIAGPYQVAMRVIPTPEELEMAETDYEGEDAFSSEPEPVLLDLARAREEVVR
jgi:hypothetical protein